MKRILLLVFVVSQFIHAYGQAITDEILKSYHGNELVFKENGDVDFVASALKISALYSLDKDNYITKTTIINTPNSTKEHVYVGVNEWFFHSFDNEKSIIQLNDKDTGVILGKGFVKGLAAHSSIMTRSEINAYVTVRADIKEGRFRVVTTIQDYDVETGRGIIGIKGLRVSKTRHTSWSPGDFFPFDDRKYKHTTAKAFVGCYVWSQITIDRLIEAVSGETSGAEDGW